jgi:hypothetical protein
MRTDGQNCAEKESEKNYADYRRLTNPPEQVSDEYRADQDHRKDDECLQHVTEWHRNSLATDCVRYSAGV